MTASLPKEAKGSGGSIRPGGHGRTRGRNESSTDERSFAGSSQGMAQDDADAVRSCALRMASQSRSGARSAEQEQKLRKCSTCDTTKPIDEFDGPRARRCRECTRRVIEDSWCRICGKKLELRSKGSARHVCETNECMGALHRRIGALAWRDWERPSTKKCRMCMVEKPLTKEHFGIARRSSDGTITRFDSLCRPCRRAVNRDRYNNDPRYRLMARRGSQRAAAKRRQRLREDPVYAANWRRKRRKYEDARIARLQAGTPSPPEESSRRGKPRDAERLATYPLAMALQEMMDQTMRNTTAPWFYGVPPEALTYAAVICERAGIHTRQLYAWKRGEIPTIGVGRADAILANLDLLWWEVWRLPSERVGTGRPREVLEHITRALEHQEAMDLFEGNPEEEGDDAEAFAA